MKNKTKCLIKDLELQLDFLTGYVPSGAHWKMEYHIREKWINEVIASEYTPQEIVDKIARVQNAMYMIRSKEKPDQSYVGHYDELKPHDPILVRGTVDGRYVEYWM